MIFRSFGDDYANDTTSARKEFDLRIGKYIPKVDRDLNAREDTDETVFKHGRLRR